MGSLAHSKGLGELSHGGSTLDLGVDLSHWEARFGTLSCLLLAPAVDQFNHFLRNVLVCSF
jgi:hypothetical protein